MTFAVYTAPRLTSRHSVNVRKLGSLAGNEPAPRELKYRYLDHREGHYDICLFILFRSTDEY